MDETIKRFLLSQNTKKKSSTVTLRVYFGPKFKQNISPTSSRYGHPYESGEPRRECMHIDDYNVFMCVDGYIYIHTYTYNMNSQICEFVTHRMPQPPHIMSVFICVFGT